MKRAFATIGVMGLALLTVTAPASADSEVYLCHATKSDKNPYTLTGINHSGLHGHDKDPNDIIPPNEFLTGGWNWDAAGQAIHANGCKPVTTPPVEEEEEEVVTPPVVEEEVVTPPVVEVVADPPAAVPVVVVPPVVAPPAAKTPVPKAAPAKAPAAAPVSQGTNQGYNAQTSVGGNAGDGAPTWLGGLGALLAAGLAVAARRRSRTE